MLHAVAMRVGFGRAIVALRLAQYPVRLLLRLLESFVPVQRGLVLFGSPRDRFADNAAYAFLHASRSRESAPIWVTGSSVTAARLRLEGLPVVMRWSLRGILCAARAEMFVVCGYRADINSFFGSRAILVNLWHGIPYKRIERDVTVGPLAILHRPRAAYSPVVKALACDTATPDFLVSPSSFVTETCLQSAFAIDASRCWDVGYPRNDHLRPGAPVLTSPALVQDAGRWHSLAAATVVGYFPTWRDNGHAVYQDAGFDLEQLARTVADIGGILIFKPHYNEPPPQLDVPGLVVLGADEDLHAYLGICDLLITDYSSVALDYALTGRPVLYFTPDLEEYSRTRGLYFAPDSVLLGPALSTGPEVLAAVRAWHDDPRPPSAAYAQIRRRFWQGYDFAACEAVVARVEAVLGAEVDGLMKERLIE